jgi:hypothetical protein
MHYADGTPVKLGDLCRTVANPDNARTYVQTEQLGQVVNGVPASGSCNVHVQTLAIRAVGPLGVGPWQPAADRWPASINAHEAVLVVAAPAVESAIAADPAV